jgi:hypothetical protein
MAAPFNILRGVKTGGMITAYPARAFNIVASDTTEYPGGVAVYVGGAGDVVVEPISGAGGQAPTGYSDTTVTFTLEAGQFVPVTVKRVLATGTDATAMVAIY